MLISLMDGSLVWSNQHHQSGTLMPSGAVHTIIASAATQSIYRHPERCDGLLRGACHRAALCADPLARNDGKGDRGREGFWPPLPPNRTGGFPAYGSPVAGFLIGGVSRGSRLCRVREARLGRRRRWASAT